MAHFGKNRTDYRWFDPLALPPPRFPLHRCAHKELYQAQLKAVEQEQERLRGWKRRFRMSLRRDSSNTSTPLTSDEQQIEVWRRWFTSLGQSEFQACRYHQMPTAQIWTAVRSVWDTTTTASWNRESLESLIASTVPNTLQRSVNAAFFDPIWWAMGDTAVTNGQHRICAAKAGRVPEVLVLLGEP